MNYIETELTLEEYNAVMEAREEAAYDIYVESLENYVYNEAVSSSTKSEFKRFKKEFKTELDKLKEAIKDNNTKEAKSKVKKLRSMLDNIKDKIENEPEDSAWDFICMIFKGVGIYLITFFTFNFLGGAALAAINHKEIKKMVRTGNMEPSKGLLVQGGIASFVAKFAAISAETKSVVNDLSNTKGSIIRVIDIYDGNLAKLERNL